MHVRALRPDPERNAHSLGEAGLAKVKVCLNQLDVAPLQRIVHHALVLVNLKTTSKHHNPQLTVDLSTNLNTRARSNVSHHDGAGRVDDEAASLGARVHRVDRRQDQLLLQMRAAQEVLLRLQAQEFRSELGC